MISQVNQIAMIQILNKSILSKGVQVSTKKVIKRPVSKPVLAVEKPRPFVGAARDLANALKKIDQTINTLETDFAPVLRQEAGDTQVKVVGTDAMSDASFDLLISGVKDRLAELNARLVSIHKRNVL